MARYHVNPKTGRPNLCNAKTPETCDYYNGETGKEAPHFATKTEAREHVEKEMNKLYGNFGSSIKKPKVKPLAKIDTSNYNMIEKHYGFKNGTKIFLNDNGTIEAEHLNYISLTNAPWEYNMIQVLKDPNNADSYYIGTDSGCSCPTPFENYKMLDDFTGPLTPEQANTEIKSLINNSYDFNDSYKKQLIEENKLSSYKINSDGNEKLSKNPTIETSKSQSTDKKH